MSCPRTQHNVPQPGLKPGPLNLEASAQTMRPLDHSCPILSNRFHLTKQHSICCRSENCISLAISGQSAACRFDRFVPFVKWKSLLPIRQVRSSIGQSHLISNNGGPVQDCRIDRFVRLVGMAISLMIPH